MGSRKKVYLLLTGLGLVALGIDRFYLGTTMPDSIRADETGAHEVTEESYSEPSRTGRSRSLPPSAAPLGVPQLHFPRNLPAYDPSHEMRDIFARAGAAREVSQNPAKDSKSPAGAGNAIGRETFPTKHKVSAIMIQEGLRIAVIDGRWMRIGDKLDGCELTRIEGDFAVFQCQDGDVQLSPNRNRKRLAD